MNLLIQLSLQGQYHPISREKKNDFVMAQIFSIFKLQWTSTLVDQFIIKMQYSKYYNAKAYLKIILGSLTQRKVIYFS